MILVTGCTGFVGSALVRRLVKEGYPVRGLVHSSRQFKDKETPAIPMFKGDINHRDSLVEALRGVDTVIHLVGILVEGRGNTFMGVHGEGVGSLVAAAKQAGVKRFLHMSALGTRPDGASKYHQSKWQGEEAVRQSGLDYTIFRPSVIFGPHDEFVNQFAKIIRYSPVAPLLGDGKVRMQPVWVEDVVECFVAALTNPATYGQTYELGGPDQLTFRAIMAAIVRAMGRKRFMVSIPFSILNLEAVFFEMLPKPPLTRDQLIMAREDNICDNGPMRQTFGLKPRSFLDGLRDYSL